MLLWARGISKYALTLRYELIQLKTICVFAELGLIWFIVDWIVICQLKKFFDFGLHWVVLATDTLFPYYRSGFTHNWSYLEHYMPLNGHTPNLNKNFLPFSKKRHENYVLLSISDHPVSRVYSLVICDWVLPCWPILDLIPLIIDFFFLRHDVRVVVLEMVISDRSLIIHNAKLTQMQILIRFPNFIL